MRVDIAARSFATAPLAAATRDVHAHAQPTGRRSRHDRRRSRRHLLPGAALVHRRGRRRNQRARQPGRAASRSCARAIDAGARLARPGEFTLRAFLNGKLDLVQAEAVADLIAAATPLQARVAFDQLEGTLTRRIAALDAALFDLIARLEASLDFPDEGYHFIEPAVAIACGV